LTLNEAEETQTNVEGSEPTATAVADLQTEIAEARAALARAEQERQMTEAAAEHRLAELGTRNAELERTMLAAHRRAVLAEHSGQVVPELVQGATAEEIDASVETARAAYARVAESVRASDQAARPAIESLPVVPAGASPRGDAPADDLSPLQKITSALGRNGR